MRRMTAKELKEFREAALVCELCGEPFTPTNPRVVDHDHTAGIVRGVLHRGCNAMLGHIENNGPRYFLRGTRLAKWARNLIPYMTKPRDDALFYPTHRTADEKRELRNKRARIARAARKAT